MGVSRLVGGVAALSLLCLLVVLLLLSQTSPPPHTGEVFSVPHPPVGSSPANSHLSNPFSLCAAHSYTSRLAPPSVGVVLTIHNKHPDVLFQTVFSILANSQRFSPQIIIVDDHSRVPVKSLETWKSVQAEKAIKVITLSERKGNAYAKKIACEQLRGLGAEVVVFLEVGSVVSEQWLVPLMRTLQEHPHSLVYPAIDVFDDVEGFFYQAGNTVASLDWSLRLIWEDVDGLLSTDSLKKRLPLVAESGHSATDAVYSPVAPTTFAARLDFLESIGDFSSYPMFSFFGTDNIELSLRTWLCADGGIIRQPCSRVAVRRKIQKKDPAHEKSEHKNHVIVDVFDGIGSDSGMHADDEYTQYDADQDAHTIAEMWMGEPYTQFVVNSRIGWGSSDEGAKGTGRFPYEVKKHLDARHSNYLSTSSKTFSATFDHNQCKRFAWYLHAVNPALLLDLPVSEMHSMDNLLDKNLKAMMSPIMKQYKSSVAHSAGAAATAYFTPKHATYELPTKAELDAIQKKKEYEELAYKVRDEHLCIDVDAENCAKEKENKGCTLNIGYTMFHCPKTCGFCTSGGEELCIDFYLNKCPKLAAEGKCTDDTKANWMKENCRQSCKICSRDGDVSEGKKNPLPKTPAVRKPEADLESTVMSPYVAQKQWKSGKNPDVIGADPCFLKHNANGKLLDNIHIHKAVPTRPGNRLFCGTYTYEKNHATNVRIMKQTWTKKCDGWMAFSTVDDASIPSVNIKHEGEESWNNMWQKIRSIWKYVHKNYRDDFDWFLLGGDDMYFIVENLKNYLESSEIVEASKLKKGLFLGRRFFPPTQVEFNSGGAGYILDRVALDVLVSHIDGPPCMPHQKGFWEDVNTASCLQKVKEHIFPYDTRDEYGRERFHPFQPANHLTYQIPKNPDWYAKYNPELKVGLECCSSNSVSFHYAKGDFMQKLNDYIYSCSKKLDLRPP